MNKALVQAYDNQHSKYLHCQSMIEDLTDQVRKERALDTSILKDTGHKQISMNAELLLSKKSKNVMVSKIIELEKKNKKCEAYQVVSNKNAQACDESIVSFEIELKDAELHRDEAIKRADEQNSKNIQQTRIMDLLKKSAVNDKIAILERDAEIKALKAETSKTVDSVTIYRASNQKDAISKMESKCRRAEQFAVSLVTKNKKLENGLVSISTRIKNYESLIEQANCNDKTLHRELIELQALNNELRFVIQERDAAIKLHRLNTVLEEKKNAKITKHLNTFYFNQRKQDTNEIIELKEQVQLKTFMMESIRQKFIEEQSILVRFHANKDINTSDQIEALQESNTTLSEKVEQLTIDSLTSKVTNKELRLVVQSNAAAMELQQTKTFEEEKKNSTYTDNLHTFYNNQSKNQTIQIVDLKEQVVLKTIMVESIRQNAIDDQSTFIRNQAYNDIHTNEQIALLEESNTTLTAKIEQFTLDYLTSNVLVQKSKVALDRSDTIVQDSELVLIKAKTNIDALTSQNNLLKAKNSIELDGVFAKVEKIASYSVGLEDEVKTLKDERISDVLFNAYSINIKERTTKQEKKKGVLKRWVGKMKGFAAFVTKPFKKRDALDSEASFSKA